MQKSQELDLPVEILNGLGATIEQLTPDVVQHLGRIATINEKSPEQEWVHAIADATQRIQDASSQIFDAINLVSTRQIDESDQTVDSNEINTSDEYRDLSALENEVLLYLRSVGATRMEEIRRDIEEVSSMSEKEYKSFRSYRFGQILDKITKHLEFQGVTANIAIEGEKRGRTYRLVESIEDNVSTEPRVAEKPPVEMQESRLSPIDKALVHLMGTQKMEPLKDIIKVVFGRHRIKKSDEQALTEVLDRYVAAGLLKRYGKQYGVVPEEERVQLQFDGSSETVSLSDRQIVEFIENISDKQKRLNIGQIVRGYFDTKTLPPDKFQAVVQQLNKLADQGYLAHEEGTAWYKLGEKKLPPKDLEELQLPEILTGDQVAPDTKKPKDSLHELEPDTAVKIDRGHTATDKKNKNMNLDEHGLTTRESEMTHCILASIESGVWFRQMDVDLRSIHFSSDSAKKQAFGKLTQKLLEQGLLISNGKARGGRRYKIVVEHDTTDGVQQTHDFQGAARTDHDDKKDDAAVVKERHIINSREERKAFSRAARFTKTITGYIRASIKGNQDDTERVATVSKDVSEKLGITRDQARGIISQLVENGDIHYSGTRRGSKLISITSLDADNGSNSQHGKKRVDEDPEDNRTDVKELTEDDIIIANEVFDHLLDLTHVQQGIEIKKLVRELKQSTSMDEKSLRRSIRKLESRGMIIIDKRANPNTRSDHSKKLYLPLVKLPSQDFKLRLKKDRLEIIDELRREISERQTA